MTTTAQELSTILTTLVGPNYSNSDVANYYDTTTLLPKAPSVNPDRGLQILVETILYERNPASYGYNIALTSTTKKELYQDIVDDLTASIAAITAVKTAINTVLSGL